MDFESTLFTDSSSSWLTTNDAVEKWFTTATLELVVPDVSTVSSTEPVLSTTTTDTNNHHRDENAEAMLISARQEIQPGMENCRRAGCCYRQNERTARNPRSRAHHCSKKQKNSVVLSVHEPVHTETPDGMRWVCPYPGCTTPPRARYYSAMVHAEIHSPYRTKKFICATCTRGYFRKQDLLRHDRKWKAKGGCTPLVAKE